MTRINKITGYKTSKDYKRLVELMKVQSVICIVNYGDSSRDIAHTLYEKYEDEDGEDYQISARGIEYCFANSEEKFIKQCVNDNVEFLEPEK